MKNVVILGAGYAGLTTLKGLKKAVKAGEVKVTLVNKNSYHYDTVNLHEVSAGNIPAKDICIDIKDVVVPGVEFVQDEVIKIDTEKKLVLTKKHELDYDVLVIGLGFQPETFGIEGMAENALPIADVLAAEKIATTLEDNFRKYATSEEKDVKDISVIVGGTGLAGMEFLGELVHRKKELCNKYGIDEKLVNSDYARKYLEDNGIEIILGAGIKGATKDSFTIEVDGERKELRASTLVWTAGVRGNKLMDETFPELSKRGRLVTTQQLTVPGHDDIYIVGDCAAFIETGQERPYPTTAQIANQMGAYVGARISGKESGDFKYINRGVVCSLGSKDGIANVMGGKKAKGFKAAKLKKIIEAKAIYELTDFLTALKNQRVL